MKIQKIAAGTALCIGMAALIAACGGGSSGSSSGGGGGGGSIQTLEVPYSGSTAKANITTLVTTAATTNDFLPICSAVSATPKLATGNVLGSMLQKAAVKQLAKATYMSVPAIPTTSYNSYATAQPGSCGGTIQIPSSTFSHTNGTSRGTIVYSNYCNYDSGASGPSEVMDGSVTFVSNGVSSATGPVVSSFDSTIPKLTVTQKDANGNTTSTSSIAATGIKLTPATTSSTIDITQAVVSETSSSTTKTTMVTGLKVVSTDTTAGGSTESITGKLYMGSSGYVDITTKTPLTTDSAGKYTAGALTLSGDGATIDLTVDTTATGSALQFTVPGSTKKLSCSSL